MKKLSTMLVLLLSLFNVTAMASFTANVPPSAEGAIQTPPSSSANGVQPEATPNNSSKDPNGLGGGSGDDADTAQDPDPEADVKTPDSSTPPAQSS